MTLNNFVSGTHFEVERAAAAQWSLTFYKEQCGTRPNLNIPGFSAVTCSGFPTFDGVQTQHVLWSNGTTWKLSVFAGENCEGTGTVLVSDVCSDVSKFGSFIVQ